YGARELHRTVERELEMKLADNILNSSTVKKTVWKVVLSNGVVEIG
ncbi:MAG: hypothetical protein JZU65_13540, partial [Chlorobium sp.]|nr:hypothetical protein [Chlorobium sp.]